MTHRQLRVLIGDTGGLAAITLADLFVSDGDWAVVRSQNESAVFEAVRREHPDVLLLDGCSGMTNLIPMVEKVQLLSDLKVIVMMHRPDSYDEMRLRRIGAMCCRYPENLSELHQEIRHLFGQKDETVQEIESSTEVMIRKFVQSTGIPANLQGYRFLHCGIRAALETPHCKGYMMRCIYPAIAGEMNTTVSNADRSLRHAIAQIWSRANWDSVFNAVFGRRTHMSNSEFIAFAVEFLQMKQKAGSK